VIDAFSNLPTGPDLDLYPDWQAAFAEITVRPRADGGRKPEMPLLNRGQSFTDERGDAWTVLHATVVTETDEFSGDELPYHYAYVYKVVNGKRQLD
jgi:hypothetical protein